MELFSSLENEYFISYPERLVASVKNFKTVFSAWNGDELVGIICVMDDGIMNAYIHYLFVKPKYRLKGIGKQLINHVRKQYIEYYNITILAYEDFGKFYEYSGCEKIPTTYQAFIKR